MYWISILFLVFFPILFISLLATYFNINLESFQELEEYRYYINDDIASLISRIAGAGFIFVENFSKIFPIGSYNILAIDSFWGYPTHNYLYYSIMKYGVFGLLFVIFLLKLTYKIMLYNFSLGLTFLFCITNFNDFYIGFILFLIPVFLENFNLKFDKEFNYINK